VSRQKYTDSAKLLTINQFIMHRCQEPLIEMLSGAG